MIYTGFESCFGGLKKEGVADRAGFEPALGYYPKHAFQACDLNRSSTCPKGAIIAERSLRSQLAASGGLDWPLGQKLLPVGTGRVLQGCADQRFFSISLLSRDFSTH